MPAFLLSAEAKLDLLSIARYTELEWNRAQAEKYIQAIEACCSRLSINPALGRTFDPRRPQLRRMNQGSHVVFYRLRNDDVFVVRILHQRMLPDRHLPQFFHKNGPP